MATVIEQKSIRRTSLEFINAAGQAIARVSELIWFFVALCLFLVMGPFAAPVVLLVLFNMDEDMRGSAEPHALDE